METQVLKEIKEVRHLLSKIVGTSDLSPEQQFSEEVLDNAAKEFRQLTIKRGEWITEYEINKIIKNPPRYTKKFIIEKFGFSNYFKLGKTTYFNKKDIIALNNALKERNINLRKYDELLEDEDKFNKKVEDLERKMSDEQNHFIIPDDLKDIESEPFTLPSDKIIKDHIASLKEDFKKYNLSEYVDIFHDTHAMMKNQYYFNRYMDNEKKKRCKKWCEDFNYANKALMEYHKLG